MEYSIQNFDAYFDKMIIVIVTKRKLMHSIDYRKASDFKTIHYNSQQVPIVGILSCSTSGVLNRTSMNEKCSVPYEMWYLPYMIGVGVGSRPELEEYVPLLGGIQPATHHIHIAQLLLGFKITHSSLCILSLYKKYVDTICLICIKQTIIKRTYNTLSEKRFMNMISKNWAFAS